jgi:hypothetical protein
MACDLLGERRGLGVQVHQELGDRSRLKAGSHTTLLARFAPTTQQLLNEHHGVPAAPPRSSIRGPSARRARG